jgi:hypothetical protein
MTKYSMRFDDLTKRPIKPQRPLTYTESLQAKLLAELHEAEVSNDAPEKITGSGINYGSNHMPSQGFKK